MSSKKEKKDNSKEMLSIPILLIAVAIVLIVVVEIAISIWSQGINLS